MSSYAEKSDKIESQSLKTDNLQKRSHISSATDAVDNRLEATVQAKFQTVANESQQLAQLNGFQEAADGSPQLTAITQLQAYADAFSGQHQLIQMGQTPQMGEGIVQGKWMHATTTQNTNLKKSGKKTIFKKLVPGGNLENADAIMVDEEDPANTERRIKAKAFNRESNDWVEGYINRDKYTLSSKEPNQAVKDFLMDGDAPATESEEELTYHALFGANASGEATSMAKGYTTNKSIELFHGTQEENKESILANGLRVGGETKASGGADMTHWQKNVVGKIFFGTSKGAAKNNAKAFAKDNGQKGGVITVIKWTVPEGTELHTDPDLTQSLTHYSNIPGGQLSEA